MTDGVLVTARRGHRRVVQREIQLGAKTIDESLLFFTKQLNFYSTKSVGQKVCVSPCVSVAYYF